MAKITICCSECGSEEVSRDAIACWDIDTQQWVLGSVYDDGYCNTCERSRRLEEKPYIEEEE